MKTPHKHAELIKKWADDTSIKIQMKHGEIWHDILGDPSWHMDYEYRIKPEVIRYRVALFDGKRKYTQTTETSDRLSVIESYPNFIKWITDWIEVEI